MTVNADNVVSISETKQDFSRVARLVDKNGAAVILKNKVPRYIILAYTPEMSTYTGKSFGKNQQPTPEIENVRQLLRKEMSEKGTLGICANAGDGWEAHVKEHYAQH